MDTNIRIAGQAGQGVQTTGNVLVGALASYGVHVFASQSYMSRIRGGLNWYDVRISDCELFSGRQKADILVALTDQAVDELRDEVAQGGKILFDGDGLADAIGIPFTKCSKEIAGTGLMANTVASGAVFALLGYPVDKLCQYLEEQFSKKGPDLVRQNIDCARRGAELAQPHHGLIKSPPANNAPVSVYNGADAVGLSAARAGVKFVASYPMTPSTAVFTYLAAVADEYGILVEQAEDEIAAVNMICGATYAGVPAMTTTSGGGFALMVEGLSLAGMLELPILILNSQRPGPATGLPTRTAQQDLKFVLNAGHGEFARAVFAPGTIQQAYELTRQALQTAHKFQTPVILMTDQFLIDTQKNIPDLDGQAEPIDRCILDNPGQDYVRYALADNGVSPRALPGASGFVVCDSDEHTEDGHITEDLRARVRLQDKRLAKVQPITAEAIKPLYYGPRGAERIFIAWGSTYGPCREAVDILNENDVPTGMLHFSQVWPINVDAVNCVLNDADVSLSNPSNVISVEGNATGQFASILRQTSLLQHCQLMLRYDGLPFTGQEIARRTTNEI